jgi:hypothetical protein
MGKATFWIGGIFAATGLLLAVVGGWLYFEDHKFARTGVRAQGTVIELVGSRGSDGDHSYRPHIEFRDSAGARHHFISRVGSNPPRHLPGERVDVLYEPWSPGNAVIDSFFDRFFLPLMFIGLGTLFAAVGGGLLFFLVRRRRIVAQLRSTGLPIQAQFVECYLDTSIRVNGRSPWRVICQATHPTTGKLETFRSDAVWTDPTGQVVGRALRVLVDPARPKRHFVDLSFLDDGAAV